MRTSFVALAGSLLLAACVSGTRVVYVPVPADGSAPAPAATPAPAPRPVEVAPPPVAVTIVRADEGRLLVSLDRPSYLAVFDIVPGRGVTLLYPASPRQRQVVLSGARWLDPRWGTLGNYDNASTGRYDRNRTASLTHYVYAVASDRPLRLSDAMFDDTYLASSLGVRVARLEDPYDTRDAIVRQFVASTREEDWGEDMYTMEAMRSVQTVRVARVYCPGGSVIYVRDEISARAYCPTNASVHGMTPAARPDSVVAWNGRRVPQSYDPNVRTPVYRVPRPIGGHEVGRVPDGRDNGNTGANRGNGNNGNAGNNGGADANANAASNNGHGNNGHHYGWQNGNNGNNGNGNSGNGNNNGTPVNQPVSQAGNGVQQQGQPQGNGNSPNAGSGNSQNNGNASNNGNAHGNNDHAQGQPQNAKPESQPTPQAESKPAPAAEAAKPPKPASVSDLLKRGKTPAKKAAPADSSSKAPKPL